MRAAYLLPSAVGGGLDCLDPASDVVRRALTQPPPALDARLDARALAADVREMRGILAREYAGFGQLLQHPTFDLDDFFSSWSSALEQGPERVGFEAEVLSRVVQLKRMVGDRHLKIAGLYSYFAKHPALAIQELSAPAPPDLDLARCEPDSALLERTLRVADSADGRIVVASQRGPAAETSVRCGSVTLRLVPRVGAAFTQAPAYRFEAEDDAAILTLGNLSRPEELAPLLQDLPRYRSSKLLVVDLRNNGGGSDAPIFRFVEQMAASVYADVVHVTGASAQRCGVWNNVVADQAYEGSLDTAAAGEQRAQLLQRMSGPAPEQPRIGPSLRRFEAKQPYQGRVVVLVNHHSASSAEGAARLLAGALGAILVGERTGGYFEFGEVTPFVMSNTGIVWDIPTKRFYAQPRVEEVGLPVDYYLSAAQLAKPAKELLPILRKLTSARERER